MKIHVSLYANLRRYAPGSKASYELTFASGASIKQLIAALRIPQNVKMVILVNGRRAEEDTQLKAGDKVTLFPPMEGG